MCKNFHAYVITLYTLATNSGTGESLMLEGEYLYSSHSVLSAATLQNAPIIIINNSYITLTLIKVFTNLRFTLVGATMPGVTGKQLIEKR